jgi:hypothetical protein
MDNFDNNSIFRQDAIRKYAGSNEKAVPLKLKEPHTLFLWGSILTLLLGVVVAACMLKIPIHVSGLAVTVGKQSLSQTTARDDSTYLLILVPPQHSKDLTPGRKVFFSPDEQGRRVAGTILSAEPGPVSPDTLVRRYALSDAAAARIGEPKAVAIARMEQAPEGVPASGDADSLRKGQFELAAQPVASLLPWIGHFFESGRAA